jgi:hypothetical protein
MKEAMVGEVVVEGGIEEVVGEEMGEVVVVVTPFGSSLSSKTAADTVARLVPQLGNSELGPVQAQGGRSPLGFSSIACSAHFRACC